MTKSKWFWIVLVLVALIVFTCLIGAIIGGYFLFSVNKSTKPPEVSFLNLEDGQEIEIEDSFPSDFTIKLSVDGEEDLNFIYISIDGNVEKILRNSPYEYKWSIPKEGEYEISAESTGKNSMDKYTEIIKVEVIKSKVESSSNTSTTTTTIAEGKAKEPPPPPKPKGYSSPIAATRADVGSGYVFKEISNNGSTAEVLYGPPESEFIGSAICKKLDDGSWVVVEHK